MSGSEEECNRPQPMVGASLPSGVTAPGSLSTSISVSISDLVSQIIDGKEVTTLFQPIVDLQSGDIFGYEALTRGPSQTPLESPAELFGAATTYGHLGDLELLCQEGAIREIARSGNDRPFFLNVSPSLLQDERFAARFLDALRRHGVGPNQIFLEITETDPIVNHDSFHATLDGLTKRGLRWAVDDVGSGYSGLTMLVRARPHVIKIDRAIIIGMHGSGFKQNLFRFLREFADSTGTLLVAEGVENEADLEALLRLGASLGQGYYLAAPGELVQRIDNERRTQTCALSRSTSLVRCRHSRVLPVSRIARSQTPVPDETPCSQVQQLFLDNRSLAGLPVVDADGRAAGLVMRATVCVPMRAPDAPGELGSCPVSVVVDRTALRVPATTPLETVARQAVARREHCVYDPILVVDESEKYVGLVSVRDLLAVVTDLGAAHARYANPTTGLPGNVVAEQELARVIGSEASYSAIYADINRFKDYNDCFGFAMGDSAIRFTGGLLEETFSAPPFESPLVAHMSDDDFLVVVSTHDVGSACEALARCFDEGMCDYFPERVVEQGYFTVTDRKGTEHQMELTTLSICVIDNEGRVFNDPRELLRQANDLRVYCKNMCLEHRKSCYALDRRRE